MVMTGERPGTDVEPPHDRARRRRRWPWIAGLVAAIALLGGLVSVLTWTAHYQPFLADQGGMESAGVRVSTRHNIYGIEDVLHRPDPGTQVTLTAGFALTGKVPITVLSIGNPWPHGQDGMVHVADNWTVEMRMVPGQDAWEAFRPTQIDEGNVSELQLRMHFTIPDSCSRREVGANGGTRSATSLPITYRVFGVTHTAWVPTLIAYSLEDTIVCP